MAIKSFADERTMRFEAGDIALDAPPALQRRALRLLRAIDAAPDLRTLRALPSLAGAELVEGSCVVPLGDSTPPGGLRPSSSWQLTFRWHDDDAWNVRVEEA